MITAMEYVILVAPDNKAAAPIIEYFAAVSAVPPNIESKILKYKFPNAHPTMMIGRKIPLGTAVPAEIVVKIYHINKNKSIPYH